MEERAFPIRELRRRLGWSQDRLAKEMGVTTNAVARWEQGNRQPSEMAIRFLEVLWERHLGERPPERPYTQEAA